MLLMERCEEVLEARVSSVAVEVDAQSPIVLSHAPLDRRGHLIKRL